MTLVMAPTGMPGGQDVAQGRSLVIDTNVVLDLLVFDDPSTRPLRLALDAGTVTWLASAAMREELRRVLAYPRVQQHLLARGHTVPGILAAFDRRSQTVAEPPATAVRCRDPDDQVFVDLAVERQACLWSKDMAVLCLRTRLAGLGVQVRAPALSRASRPAAGSRNPRRGRSA